MHLRTSRAHATTTRRKFLFVFLFFVRSSFVQSLSRYKLMNVGVCVCVRRTLTANAFVFAQNNWNEFDVRVCVFSAALALEEKPEYIRRPTPMKKRQGFWNDFGGWCGSRRLGPVPYRRK